MRIEGKTMRKVLLGCSLIALSSASVFANPARPGIIQLRQSDGTTVDARLIGDEYYHTYTTADGYPLVFNAGNYEYAGIEGGKLISTGIKAVNKDERPAGHLRVLESLSVQDLPSVHDRAYAEARQRYFSDQPRKAPLAGDRSRFMMSDFPNTGKQKGLIILVEYQDVRFSLSDPHDYFTRLLNEPGFSDCGGTGSAREFFIESSHGQFEPEFDVFGPVLLPENQAYYGSNTGGYNDAYAWKMITTAAQYLDDEIDFSEYDRDNDGYVDNVYVFYAGEGESGGGGYETVWPHSARISTFDKQNQYILDGKILDRYACSNEMDFENPDGIGTFCHEFSHVMGLPDFYATGYQSSFTPSSFSTLDSGSYNNNGRTPPLYSAFERYCAGWLDLEVIGGRDNIVLLPIGANKAYAIETGNPDEFYILENRQQVSWDTYLPGHGMLVWHVDYDADAWSKNAVNNDPQRQHLDIVEADDMRDYDSFNGDPFPGVKGVTSFTDDTTPSMKTWDGNRLSMPITEITETEDGFITFKVAGGHEDVTRPGMPEVLEAGAYGAALQWDAVEGAADYKVTVLTPGDNFLVAGWFKTSTKGGTSVVVGGLKPETTYICYVQASDGVADSSPSPMIEFTTGSVGFSDMIATASQATDITDSSFTANWEMMDEAVDYNLTVYSCAEGDPYRFILDFAGGISDLPSDWTSSSRSVYNMASYSGKAAPSLRMNATGDLLQTGEYTDRISALSFWHRGNGSATSDNNIVVEGNTPDGWTTLATIPVVSAQNGHVETISSIPEGTVALRLSYTGDAKGSLAIDDIEIYHGHNVRMTVIDGYDGISAGNTASLSVTGLEASSDYSYTVRGVDAYGNLSAPSDYIYVSTKEAGGVEGIEETPAYSERVSVYDLTGRKVASGKYGDLSKTLVSGIYIVKTSNKTIKVII